MYDLKHEATDYFKGKFQQLSEAEWALCRPEIGGDEASLLVAAFHEGDWGHPDYVEVTIEEFDFVDSNAYAEEGSAAHDYYWDTGWVKDWLQTRKELEVSTETWMIKQGWGYQERSKYYHDIFREIESMNERVYDEWDQ